MSSDDKTRKATNGVRTPITRRDFLKTAGVAGLAVGAGRRPERRARGLRQQ